MYQTCYQQEEPDATKANSDREAYLAASQETLALHQLQLSTALVSHPSAGQSLQQHQVCYPTNHTTLNFWQYCTPFTSTDLDLDLHLDLHLYMDFDSNLDLDFEKFRQYSLSEEVESQTVFFTKKEKMFPKYNEKPKKNPQSNIVFQGGPDELDCVIKRKQIPVDRAEFNGGTPGNCWYASIAFLVDRNIQDGRMSREDLNISPTALVDQQTIRSAVCAFIESADCILRDDWIDAHFGGDYNR